MRFTCGLPNDINQDTLVDFTTLGVVHLDTSIISRTCSVLGLWLPGPGGSGAWRVAPPIIAGGER